MGNSFAIQGLTDEATHERRDVDIRQVGTGERPDENELVETKTPKPAESHIGTNRKRVCGFLLVINTKLGPILQYGSEI